MKFSTCVFSLCVLVASASAACSCSSSDQACMDKCVLAANSCIVQCKDGGDACQKACISSHWPASPLSQKDVMAAPTGNPSMTSMDGSAPTGTHSESVRLSTYSTTLSGSAVVVTATIKPSSTPNNGNTTSTKSDGTNANTSSGSRQMVPMVTIGILAMVAWVL